MHCCANLKGRLFTQSPTFAYCLLSAHGREEVVVGERADAGLDPFHSHLRADCRPGTASQVWPCCTLANLVGRRRGPRRSRRPAARAAAVSCSWPVRKTAAAAVFFYSRECIDLGRGPRQGCPGGSKPAIALHTLHTPSSALSLKVALFSYYFL